MDSVVDKAKKLATMAHKGQFYGTGDPYIMHPTQVASLAKRLGYGEDVIAACYLHDVLEDTTVTEQELRLNFAPIIVDAVLSVTFTGSEHDLKIKQALSHPLGHVVKFCDVCCNFSNTVLHGAKEGKKTSEVVPRRAGYITKLLKDLPTPRQIEEYAQKNI